MAEKRNWEKMRAPLNWQHLYPAEVEAKVDIISLVVVVCVNKTVYRSNHA